MAKYGLSMSERIGTRQNDKPRGARFFSNVNQILFVYSVEFIVENKRGLREHITTRAVANTVEEAHKLLTERLHNTTDRLINVLDISLLGKDRTWLTEGKKANSLGPRITNEVSYRAL